jgi:hypothetical protein
MELDPQSELAGVKTLPEGICCFLAKRLYSNTLMCWHELARALLIKEAMSWYFYGHQQK